MSASYFEARPGAGEPGLLRAGLQRARQALKNASGLFGRKPVMAALSTLLAAGVAALVVNLAYANNTAQTLAFSQDWSNTGLISANDDWSSVPGIIGYSDNFAGSTVGVDPRTLTAAQTTQDVNANQTNPNITSIRGVAEFDIADDVVALAGDGFHDAPNIVLHLDTTGRQGVNVAYNLRDIDDASTGNAVMQVALQYRIGNAGAFTNVPAGYVADATTGPDAATLVTPVSATLPAAADNQSLVEVRIITANATGNEEWVGIDDISVTGSNNLPPVVTVPGAQSTNEDTNNVFSSANGNQISASDPDGNVAAQATLGVNNGTLALSTIAGLSFTTGDGTSDANMVFTGTLNDINTALNGMSYAPNADYNGSDTLSFTTNDQGNTGTGGALSDTDTVPIAITAVNDEPSFNIPAANAPTVTEDSGLATVNGFATNILKGPADENGQTLTFVLTNLTNPSLFSAQPALDPVTGNLTYTPATNAFGTAALSVKLVDDGPNVAPNDNESDPRIFTITVTPDPRGCTITGTGGDDDGLLGTEGDDVICGLGGDDTIDGLGGDDTIHGDAGVDKISGGPGDDRLFGGDGKDRLNARDGVRGNDLADGGKGKDRCNGDRGDKKRNC